LTALQAKFLSAVDPEECHSVDEQIVPFTGKSSLKQYIRNKPKKWGYKVWVRSGVSGYMYDFEIYQGAHGHRPEKNLGLCADVVMRLSQNIQGKNHKLYFDNLFTTLDLLKALRDKDIYAVGTLRKNRLMGAENVLLSDREMKERGTCCFSTSSDDITITKWNDNSFVYVASTFAGYEPTSTVVRWEKKSKKYIEVCRPKAVEVYNKHMGGVDLTDFLVSCYRHSLKHKRWYLRLFFHFLNVSIINGWIIARWEGDTADLLGFRSALARALINKGWSMKDRRPGRQTAMCQPSKLSNVRTAVPDEIRLNLGLGHWPKKTTDKNASRCISQYCSSKTRYFCSACRKALCPECFETYHQ
jgi:hypothetical protein